MFLFQFFMLLTIYANSAFGTRSPSRIAKRCRAAFQFCTSIVHFLANVGEISARPRLDHSEYVHVPCSK